MANATIVGMEPGEWKAQCQDRWDRSFSDRFWRRVPPGPGCREWTGCRQPNNYARVRSGGRQLYVHRVAWMLTYGSIPDDLFVCHACDNPACCEPTHLWLGTATDNNRDRMSKGRNRKPVIGEDHHKAKLTEAQVREIRSRYTPGRKTGDGTLGALANEFGVRCTTIHAIVKRKIWKHVE